MHIFEMHIAIDLYVGIIFISFFVFLYFSVAHF